MNIQLHFRSMDFGVGAVGSSIVMPSFCGVVL